jgi:hypothetical protein
MNGPITEEWFNNFPKIKAALEKLYKAGFGPIATFLKCVGFIAIIIFVTIVGTILFPLILIVLLSDSIVGLFRKK